jgi:hypothetical protein
LHNECNGFSAAVLKFNATLTSHELPQQHQPDFILPRLVATGQVLCHANVAAETPALIDFLQHVFPCFVIQKQNKSE